MTEVKIMPGNQPVGIGDGPKISVGWDDVYGSVNVQYSDGSHQVVTIEMEVIGTAGLSYPIFGTPYEAFTVSTDRVNEFWIREGRND